MQMTETATLASRESHTSYIASKKRVGFASQHIYYIRRLSPR
jgi:hypothetical protein